MSPNLKILSSSEGAKKLHALAMKKREAVIAAQMEAIKKDRERYDISAAKRGREQTISPTPERMAKGDIKRELVKGEGQRYRPKKGVLHHYEGKWRPEMEVAFNRLVEDSTAADVTNVTIDYNSAGSRLAGSKLGGVSGAKLDQIQKFHRFQYVMDGLTSRSRRLCEWMLLGFPREGTNDSVTLEDVGRWLFPSITDPRSSRLIGLGRLIGAGDEMVKLYASYDMEHRFHEVRQRAMKTISRERATPQKFPEGAYGEGR